MGQNAQVRQNKAIQKLIRDHKGQEDVADLVRQHNYDFICKSPRNLLCDEISTSTLKAKIRFRNDCPRFSFLLLRDPIVALALAQAEQASGGLERGIVGDEMAFDPGFMLPILASTLLASYTRSKCMACCDMSLLKGSPLSNM